MASTGSSSTGRAWVSSLKFKVAVYLLAFLIAAFSVFTWSLTRQQRVELQDTAVAHILQLSDAVVRSTRFMMMEDKPDYVHQLILDVASEKDIDRIRIFSKKGKVIDSTFAGEIGLVLDAKAEGCVSCHGGEVPPESLSDRDRVRFFEDARGRRLMGMMQVLRNEPSCQNAGCHAHHDAPAVLGVVDIVYSIDAVEQRLNRAVWNTALLASGFVLLAAICIVLIVHRLVYRPLRDLERGAGRLASGQLDEPIPVRSPDEFGQVAHSFNTMMAGLHESQKELSEAARLLERKVEERTQQPVSYTHLGHGIAAGCRALAGQLEERAQHALQRHLPGRLFALGQQGQAVVVGAQPLLILGRQQRRQHAARAVAAPGVAHRHLLRLKAHLLDHLGGHAHLVAQAHTVGRPAQQCLGQHRRQRQSSDPAAVDDRQTPCFGQPQFHVQPCLLYTSRCV